MHDMDFVRGSRSGLKDFFLAHVLALVVVRSWTVVSALIS